MPAVSLAACGTGRPARSGADELPRDSNHLPRGSGRLPGRSGRLPRQTSTLRALGTLVTLTGRGAGRVAAEVVRLEQLLTRFRPSALTALNAAGRLDEPPAELVAALRWALEAAKLSGGLVTPLIGRNLMWHGYDHSWPYVKEPRVGEPPVVPSHKRVQIGRAMISLAAGETLDLGGTGKSWIAESAASAFHGPFVLDAGGDVLLDRREPSQVAVEAAAGAEPWHLVLPPGRWGVATSSITGRAWRGAHHLIDPRTRRPVDGRWIQATVVSPSLREAEIATKLVLFEAAIPTSLQVAGAWATDRDGNRWTRTHGGWSHDPHDA